MKKKYQITVDVNGFDGKKAATSFLKAIKEMAFDAEVKVSWTYVSEEDGDEIVGGADDEL